MSMKLLILFSFTAIVTAIQQEPGVQYVQTPVQVVPVSVQPDPQILYLPVVNYEPQPEKQPLVQVSSQQVSVNQGSSSHHQAQHQHPHGTPHNHPFQIHHDGSIQHVAHNPPPAPASSVGSYTATLSYGPGYPIVVYQCSLPGHQHHLHVVQPDHVIQGQNGYICAVSSHKNYQVVHLVNQHDQVQK